MSDDPRGHGGGETRQETLTRQAEALVPGFSVDARTRFGQAQQVVNRTRTRSMIRAGWERGCIWCTSCLVLALVGIVGLILWLGGNR